MQKGAFITIYGINNIGKTTQSRLLVKRLRQNGYKAVYLKYPIYNLRPTGPILNKILRASGKQKISEDELQLWFVLNRYQYEPKLKKLLSRGYVVVAEDYTLTGIAWGTAKGLEKKWLEEANKYLLKADFPILLEGERSVYAKEENHVHESDEKLMTRCSAVFSELAKEFNLKRVKRHAEMKKTSDVIFEIVNNYLKKRLI